ncbi:MAG: phosphatase PAP2 family protein [Bacteroidales bacterium]|nr:phosphatase PAP2 family protein [Bacteroidales bacterium]
MLEELDKKFFLLINSCHSPFWDNAMWFLSEKYVWIPLYIAIAIFLGFKYKRKIWIVLLFFAFTILLSDQISVKCFKYVFCRLRPCHEPSLEGLVHIVRGHCGGMYGFVSSHAANCFNLVMLSSLFLKKRWYTLAITFWALIVCYSRIYLGVHYPGDIICGTALGLLIGFLVYKLYLYVDKRFLSKQECFK